MQVHLQLPLVPCKLTLEALCPRGCQYRGKKSQDPNETSSERERNHLSGVKPLRFGGASVEMARVTFPKIPRDCIPPIKVPSLLTEHCQWQRVSVFPNTATHHRRWSNRPKSRESGTGFGRARPGRWSPRRHQGYPPGGLGAGRRERWVRVSSVSSHSRGRWALHSDLHLDCVFTKGALGMELVVREVGRGGLKAPSPPCLATVEYKQCSPECHAQRLPPSRLCTKFC